MGNLARVFEGVCVYFAYVWHELAAQLWAPFAVEPVVALALRWVVATSGWAWVSDGHRTSVLRQVWMAPPWAASIKMTTTTEAPGLIGFHPALSILKSAVVYLLESTFGAGLPGRAIILATVRPRSVASPLWPSQRPALHHIKLLLCPKLFAEISKVLLVLQLRLIHLLWRRH